VVDTPGAFAGSEEARRLAGLARQRRTTLVVGVVEGAGPRRFRNAAVAFDPDGRLLGRYDKVPRVPFGEYVPARELFSRVADLSGVPRDAIPGRGRGLLRTPAGPLGVTISFEVFFADRARAAARAGAGLLLVPTNASSYRGQLVPAQELAAAQLRSREIGRAVLQAAPTGYSAVISHAGRVLDRSALGERSVQSRVLRARSGLTPYARVGDLPIIVLAVAGAAGAMPRRRGPHERGR
jgi:apolipoprotein N-acyltransferase